MTHGPEAVRVVGAALNDAGILTTKPVVISLTGVALDVAGLTAHPLTRDAAIDTLVYRWDVRRFEATKLLDLAVEALTANTQE